MNNFIDFYNENKQMLIERTEDISLTIEKLNEFATDLAAAAKKFEESESFTGHEMQSFFNNDIQKRWKNMKLTELMRQFADAAGEMDRTDKSNKPSNKQWNKIVVKLGLDRSQADQNKLRTSLIKEEEKWVTLLNLYNPVRGKRTRSIKNMKKAIIPTKLENNLLDTLIAKTAKYGSKKVSALDYMYFYYNNRPTDLNKPAVPAVVDPAPERAPAPTGGNPDEA